MVRIAGHISDLLYYHDCVILPNFGGFIANYHPAQLDTERKLIHPPSKIILFNKFVRVNDGLLASKIVREERVSYEKANKRLTKFVKQTQKKILAGERVEIPKVGILYLDPEENIQFIQDRNNFLPASFGLTSVDLIPVESTQQTILEVAETEQTKPSIVSQSKVITFHPQIEQETAPKPDTKKRTTTLGGSQKDRVDPQPDKKQNTPVVKQLNPGNDETTEKPDSLKEEPKRKRSGMVWAAAVIVPLFVVYGAGVAYYGTGGEESFDTASFNPISWFKSDARELAAYETDTLQADTTLADEQLIFPEEHTPASDTAAASPIMEVDTAQLNAAVPESTYVEQIVENVSDTYKYEVIGGCFSKDKYADQFIEDMLGAGFSAHQVDVHDGLRRISLGGSNSRKEARKIRKKARELGISSWILRN